MQQRKQPGMLRRAAACLLACGALCALLAGCGAQPENASPIDRITLELRTGTRWGEADETTAEVPLLDEAGAVCGGILLLPQAQPVLDEAGGLAGVSGWPQEGALEQLQPLAAPGQVPAVTALYRCADGSARWLALYRPDPEQPLCAVWLDAARWDYEAFLPFALSANFA